MADRVVYVEKKKGCLSGCGSALVLVAFIFIAAIAGVMIIGSQTRNQVQNGIPGESSAPPAAPSMPSLNVGDQVVINLPNADYGPWLATSDDAWNEMLDAENAKSMELIRRLTEQGKVIRVQNGTPGVIVKRSLMSVLVRLTGGGHSGEEGWLQREFVAPAAK